MRLMASAITSSGEASVQRADSAPETEDLQSREFEPRSHSDGVWLTYITVSIGAGAMDAQRRYAGQC